MKEDVTWWVGCLLSSPLLSSPLLACLSALLLGVTPVRGQVRLNAQVAEWKRIHDTQAWRAFLPPAT